MSNESSLSERLAQELRHLSQDIRGAASAGAMPLSDPSGLHCRLLALQISMARGFRSGSTLWNPWTSTGSMWPPAVLPSYEAGSGLRKQQVLLPLARCSLWHARRGYAGLACPAQVAEHCIPEGSPA